MPLHRREQVLAALRAQLIAANTQAAGRWFRGRTLALQTDQLPAGLVRMPPGQQAERIERADVNYFTTRTLTIMVVMKLRNLPADADTQEIETALNAFSKEVENAIEADPTITGQAIDARPTGFFTDLEGANADFGDGVLLVEVKYRAKRTDVSLP